MLFDITDHGICPVRKFPHDAGVDLFAIESVDLLGMMTLKSFDMSRCTHRFDTGVKVDIPVGSVGLIMDKGGRGDKLIKVFGGVIDAGYQDTIKIRLMNFGLETFSVKHGMALAQMIVVPCDLSPIQMGIVGVKKTDRGTQHYGSIDLSI
jgi:deoxyuridine 5'-triphosphate nucleotidohydrolase